VVEENKNFLLKGFEKELMELASSLKEKYKNRPTFLDEMQRI
jgi:hypothetical protein